MDKYKSLLIEVNHAVKSFDFRKKGETYFIQRNRNYGIINFQRRKDSSPDSTVFTINLGVYSWTLMILDRIRVRTFPGIRHCQWKRRIGFLMDQQQDHWWSIDANSSMSGLVAGISDLIKMRAIPEIEKYIIDENLERLWMDGNANSLTHQQTLLYLIALLKRKNKPELNAKVDELIDISRGKRCFREVIGSLTRLGIFDEDCVRRC